MTRGPKKIRRQDIADLICDIIQAAGPAGIQRSSITRSIPMGEPRTWTPEILDDLSATGEYGSVGDLIVHTPENIKENAK